MDGKPIRRPESKWHAVAVVLKPSSCAAATLCRDARYLSHEAPRLPLPFCSSPADCPCTFRHFEDRRGTVRRHSDAGGGNDKPKTEKRKNRGRRTRDQV